MFSQVNIQMQDSMQLKVTMQWNQNIKNRNEKTLTNQNTGPKTDPCGTPLSTLSHPSYVPIDTSHGWAWTINLAA